MKIIPEQQSPDFSLYDTQKNKVILSEIMDSNILLLFFPLAFTSVCTKELCSVRDNISLYNHFNTAVFGISVDSLYTLAKFKEEQHLNFTLLSDFNKEVSTAYDCLYPLFGYNMKGVSKRAAFVIDKNMIIQYAEVLENANDVPDFNKIVKALEILS